MFVAHYFFVHFFFCPFERSAEPSKNFHHSQETVYLVLTVSLCSGKSTRGFFFTRNEKKKYSQAASPDGQKWKARSGMDRALQESHAGGPTIRQGQWVPSFNDITMNE
jgi:hypothetical protein